MNVHIHIDRLVLEGLSLASDEGPLVQASLEAELARRLATAGLAPLLRADAALPSLPTQPLKLPDRSDPASLGRRIAGAVSEGMKR